MSLVGTSVLNAIAVAVKICVAMVLNKILAVYVGPAGYAAIGQFQNAVSVAVSLAGGVIGPGVTKGTAEYHEDNGRQHRIWRTALRLTLIGTALVSIGLLGASPWLSDALLQRSDMASVFVGLAIMLPAIAINNLLLAILNGKKDVRTYITANIVGSLLSLLLIGACTVLMGLYGALLAVAVSPGIVLMATAALTFRKSWFSASALWGKLDGGALRELGGFGLMGLTAAITAPLAYIYVRDLLSSELGPVSAGLWQASWKISEIYLMLVTLTLSVYYLPRLAEIRLADELRAEIIKVYVLVLPLVGAGACLIYFMRDFIIRTLFSDEFNAMRELFLWQLSGDVVKIGAWILSYVMLGRAMVKAFVATEILFSITFCALSAVLVSWRGLPGVSMAYVCNYACYWVAMFCLIRAEMKTMPSGRGLDKAA